MIQSGRIHERHTIPRWNRSEVGQSLGEFDAVSSKQNRNGNKHGDLNALLNEWKTEQSLPLAIEIISETELANSDWYIDDIIRYAKKRIEEQQEDIPLLKLLIHDRGFCTPDPCVPHAKSVAIIRARLSENPYNPLLWTDLAREYLILGHPLKSEKALVVARSLSPACRTVIRATARYYVHQGDLEKAQYYLAKSPIINSDPWVLAAEIAISNEMKKTSRLTRKGIVLLGDENINPRAKSELAAELATMDFISANSKNGKRKLSVACISPHENAVAQIAWINEKAYSISQIMELVNNQKVKCNYEAQTIWHYQETEWEDALRIAGQWQQYQPFSRTPALYRSEIALNYTNEITEGIQCLKEALLSNPCDISLLNNLAYAYALQGNRRDMQETLDEISSITKPEKDPILTATKGLFEYRFGNPEVGKKLYLQAINTAEKQNRLEIAYAATVYLAREEYRNGNTIIDLATVLTMKKNERYQKMFAKLIETFGLPV